MNTLLKELAAKTIIMRELQKKYFKERNSIILQQCKAAEKDVDELIKKLSSSQEDTQKRMFN